MSGLGAFWPLLVSAPLLLGGAIALAGGALGGWRLPDLYARAHAAALSDIGLFLIGLGLAALAPQPSHGLLLAGLSCAVLALGAAGRHALADGARASGLDPVVGRMGAAREDAP